MKKTLDFDTYGCYGCMFEINRYANNGALALSIVCGDGEPFADVSVNLGVKPSDGCIWLDDNNFPDGVEMMETFGFGERTGRMTCSGYCIYEEWKLNMDKVLEYTGE